MSASKKSPNPRPHGQIRQGQVITTYGPGALIDLPKYAAIVGGLDTWTSTSQLEEVVEPRLSRKLESMTGVRRPRLYVPPPDTRDPDEVRGLGAWRFPEWFVVQETPGSAERERSRRLVHRKVLDGKRSFDKRPVVPTRFVRACSKGHVADLDWHAFVHRDDRECLRNRQLWLDELGTSGDLIDLQVRCECGKSRRMYEATEIDKNPLGHCTGARPWLGPHAPESCGQYSRLLIRTASNAYFPQVVSVLSLPDRGSAVEKALEELPRIVLDMVRMPADLATIKNSPEVMGKLDRFSDEEIFEAIQALRAGSKVERPVKQVELDAILAAPEGFGDDVPVDPDFHARRLPEHVWRRSDRFKNIEAVIQLHRLREVLALSGFSRFESVTPDILGELESDVERAQIAIDPQWFPAVENRGEGIFIQVRAGAVRSWRDREAVRARIDGLRRAFADWVAERVGRGAAKSLLKRPYPGGPYVLLHTLSHLIIQSLAMHCGYPASSLRERIYADAQGERFGILIYTGSPDAEGTLGGLVQQARHVEDHLLRALRMGALCSNDPICAQHTPGKSLEQRWPHGAACHGCALVAETSCEMRNDHLDRALVVPVLGVRGTAFFEVGP